MITHTHDFYPHPRPTTHDPRPTTIRQTLFHVDMQRLPPVRHKHLFVLRKLEVAPKSIQSVTIHFKIDAVKLRFNLLQTSRCIKIVVLMCE